MKTRLLLTALSALAIAGCSQNEITEISPEMNPPIDFSVYTGVQTKGTETTTTTIQTSKFGIFAYLTSAAWSTASTAAKPEFLCNETATYSSSGTPSKWSYTNTKFWPTNSDKISFFAYAPLNATGAVLPTAATAGTPKITFTQQTAPASLIDLITAKSIDQTKSSSSGKVTFTFSHALTKMDIKAKVDVSSLGSDTKVYIKSLTLKPNAANKLPTKATYDLSAETWDYTGATYMATTGMSLAGILNKGTGTEWGYDKTAGVNITPTAASVFTSGQALYLIPAAAAGTAAAGDATLEVTYDIVTKVAGSTTANVTSTNTKTVNLPAGALKKNTFATYTLTIAMNAITIDVAASVTGWTNASSDLTPSI
ncbi:fimbrillin family protein [Bacteroides sp.]